MAVKHIIIEVTSYSMCLWFLRVESSIVKKILIGLGASMFFLLLFCIFE